MLAGTGPHGLLAFWGIKKIDGNVIEGLFREMVSVFLNFPVFSTICVLLL